MLVSWVIEPLLWQQGKGLWGEVPQGSVGTFTSAPASCSCRTLNRYGWRLLGLGDRQVPHAQLDPGKPLGWSRDWGALPLGLLLAGVWLRQFRIAILPTGVSRVVSGTHFLAD